MTDQDWWEKKTSVECPNCKTVVRLTEKQAEYDSVVISCPSCHRQFDYERPSN